MNLGIGSGQPSIVFKSGGQKLFDLRAKFPVNEVPQSLWILEGETILEA